MRTVLWDLDGTVADTEKLHFQAWQTTLSGYGVTYTYERFLSEFGRRNGDFLPALLQVEPESNLVVECAGQGGQLPATGALARSAPAAR